MRHRLVTCVVMALAWCGVGHAQGEQFSTSKLVGQPADTVDYWSGDLQVKGTARDKSGGSQTFESSMAIKVWVAEDGVARMKVDDCVSALFPEDGASLAKGGVFREDLAAAGSRPDCGMNPGDKELKEVIRFTPSAQGLKLAYVYQWSFAQPYAGIGDATGEAVLKATYRAPPKQTAQAASTKPAAVPAPAARSAPKLFTSEIPAQYADVIDTNPLPRIPPEGKPTYQLGLRFDNVDNMAIVFVTNGDDDKGHSLALTCSWTPGFAASGSVGLDSLLHAGTTYIDIVIYDQAVAGFSTFFSAGKWTYNIQLTDKDGVVWKESGAGATTNAGAKYHRRFVVQRDPSGAIRLMPEIEFLSQYDGVWYLSPAEVVANIEKQTADSGAASSDFLGDSTGMASQGACS